MKETSTLRVIKDLSLRKAAYNLALEESIVKHVNRGQSAPTVRFWRNSYSAIVGRSQRVDREVDIELCRAHGVEVVRRPSGGGAVLHHPENLNYSIYLPSRRNNMKEIKTEPYVEPLIRALKRTGLGLRPEVNGLYVDELKVSGTAQSRRWGILFHGTLLLRDHDMMGYMEDLLLAHDGRYAEGGNYVSSAPSPVASVEDLVGPPFRASSFFDSWVGLLGEVLNLTPLNGGISQHEWGMARQLAREKYGSDAWNLRFRN